MNDNSPPTYYCWRCKKTMPFLDEAVWNVMGPLLTADLEAIKWCRQTHQTDLSTALTMVSFQSTRYFAEITGVEGITPNTIYHHRLASWGSPCLKCNSLLRTPRAKFCAECGWISENKVIIP